MMKYLITFLFFCFFIVAKIEAQQLTGVYTNWNDSFAEWIITTADENEEGYLRLKWNNKSDWTQWEYRVGEWTGSIRAKWPNRLDEWEVRGENIIVDGRAMWRNDPREWRITGNDTATYKWKSRYGNTLEDWLIDSEKYGFFEVYTSYEGDLREWIIIDELNASLPEKMLLVFLTIINSTPKL